MQKFDGLIIKPQQNDVFQLCTTLFSPFMVELLGKKWEHYRLYFVTVSTVLQHEKELFGENETFDLRGCVFSLRKIAIFSKVALFNISKVAT